ncbi:Stf0 family sulfotransferase [Leptothoe spongobia]|uniref:Sulfotransferase n=1 Tax=Leptothoe spongobia TAU-MAC 1115 TaxID=1967444 RepID=A0A947DF17_9CYAN|nr:Stf0 family sulfotransferase [Leptothoe spongobia]MBT9315570.1 sulfotransferase [Leptothoe spongobia TAU-MAC 1115]
MKTVDNSIRNSIKNSYIICSTGRSGSTLFCRTLGTIEVAGNPREHFHPRLLSERAISVDNPEYFYDYYCKVIEENSSEEGVFGVKMHWDQLQDFLVICRSCIEELKSASNLEVINYMFPNTKFIYIRRGDILKQAISTEVAYQTGTWTVPKQNADVARYSKPQKTRILLFNPLGIYRYKWGLQKMNNQWKSFFEENSIGFYEVVYEELVASFDKSIHDVLDFLGIKTDSQTFDIPTKKLSNQVNKRWYFYYRAIPESLIKNYSNFRVSVRHALMKKYQDS